MITREPEFLPPPINVRGRLGRVVLLNCRNAGRALLILGEALLSLRFVLSKRSRPVVLQQLYITGIKSLGVISVVAMFTGMILALQTGLELRKFGQEVNIGVAVMVSMLREMGPFMTALILAASVGSAMAAELGTMTVSEEIAALEVMSIPPVRFLVMPRLAAMMIMTPLLTFYACMLGVAGGAIVGSTQLGVSVQAYIDNAIRWAENKDLYVGLFKSFVFGIMITAICCYEGFATTEGAVGVGRATRRSVVISFLSILVVGYIITRLFYQ
ncbi:MAG: ABC transporter permease [Kiritimatiellia bacterium]|jgi:phospholipid/cholesterol/gamma-HCH transport system permease protein